MRPSQLVVAFGYGTLLGITHARHSPFLGASLFSDAHHDLFQSAGAASDAADDYCYGLYPKGVPCPIVAGHFDQLIDHDKPELGTFKQRYWFNAEFYAGPGAPIIFNTPGESDASSLLIYVTNKTLSGTYAQDNKGALVFLEHRYFGESSPYSTLTTETLQPLTLDNSLKDLTRFAREVDLPFSKGTSSPDKSPWVFLGGSYSGALVAWMSKLYPGIFWAYHATSAVVQPRPDLWQYYQAVEEAMPRNCSKDYRLAIKTIDDMLSSRDDAGRKAIKEKFGAGAGSLADDEFGKFMALPLLLWQSARFYTGGSNVPLYNMCDYVEGVENGNPNNATIPGEEGVGACKAIKGLIKYNTEKYIPMDICSGGPWPKYSLECFNTRNKSSILFTDRSVDNYSELQWLWMLCNEPYQQFVASYPGDTGLVSKFYRTEVERQNCASYFPDGYGLKSGRTTEDIIKKTGGWNNVHTKRLIYVNGELDPWRPETVSSRDRPGGPLQSTPEVPVFLVKKGTHCADLRMQNAEVNADIAVQMTEMRKIMGGWVAEFYTEKGIQRPGF